MVTWSKFVSASRQHRLKLDPLLLSCEEVSLEAERPVEVRNVSRLLHLRQLSLPLAGHFDGVRGHGWRDSNDKQQPNTAWHKAGQLPKEFLRPSSIPSFQPQLSRVMAAPQASPDWYTQAVSDLREARQFIMNATHIDQSLLDRLRTCVESPPYNHGNDH